MLTFAIATASVHAPTSQTSVSLALGALPPSAAMTAHYFVHHKRLPDLARPTRFTEKVIRRKLVDRDPRLPILADKIAVKEFVASILGAPYVTPTLWSGESLPPRAARNRPIPYVLKANNGSGTNVFVRSAESLDWDAMNRAAEPGWRPATPAGPPNGPTPKSRRS